MAKLRWNSRWPRASNSGTNAKRNAAGRPTRKHGKQLAEAGRPKNNVRTAAAPRLSSRAKPGDSRDSAHPATASDEGLVIRVVRLSFRGGPYRRGTCCQPAARNHPPHRFCSPSARALRKPARLGVLRRRCGKDSAREIRKYFIPDFSRGRTTTHTGKHSIA